MLRSYSWFCTRRSFLAVLRGPCGMPGIELRPVQLHLLLRPAKGCRFQMWGFRRRELSPEKAPSHMLQGQMWCLLLWAVLQACPSRGSVLLAQQLPRRLTSPGYPEPYPRGQERVTNIQAPPGFTVRLTFQDFDVAPSPDCERDSVTVTASGMEPVRLCGRSGCPLGHPPGQREFVSLGNTLQLTFRAPAASDDQIPQLHKGFLALYQAMGTSHSLPGGQTGGHQVTQGTHSPDDKPSRTQSHCQEPYYQAVSTGTLTCSAWSPWKRAQDGEEAPRCEPVCGRPLAPMTQNLEAHGPRKAELGSFPWQALVSIHGRGGGALLGDRWVLTAAHSVYPKDAVFLGHERRVDVFLGHTVVDELLRLGPRAVRRVLVHPDYRQGDPHNFDGDLALLELQHPVALGPSLLPVCLPDSERLYRTGQWGAVSGFGVDEGWLAPGLKFSSMSVAPRAACQAWLRGKQRPEVFSDNMFCAGDVQRPQGVCQGDSGGAYVVWDAGARRWVATGVVSWGIGCGQGYGFYTKVLNYVGWVRDVMSGKK